MKLERYPMDEFRAKQAISRGAERARRGRMPRRVALIVAAAMLLSAGALAAARMSGWVDWTGKPIPPQAPFGREPEPAPASPESLEQEAFERAQDAYNNELLAMKPPNEYWCTYMKTAIGGAGVFDPPGETLASLDGQQARIRANGLLLPDWVPEGYALIECQLSFYFTEQDYDNTESLGETQAGYGIALRKYRPPQSLFEHVRSYALRYRNAQGQLLYIHGMLEESSEEYQFGVDEGERHEALAIAGMKHALYFSRAQNAKASLDLLQTGIGPIPYTNPADFKPEGHYFSRGTYDAAVYGVGGELTRDEMIRIAESLK